MKRTCQGCGAGVRDSSLVTCPQCGEFFPERKRGRFFVVAMLGVIGLTYLLPYPNDTEFARMYGFVYMLVRLVCAVLLLRHSWSDLYDDFPVQTSKAQGEKPTYRLYSVGQIAWATFWGTPLAGFVVLAINFSRLGHLTQRNKMFLTGWIVFVLLMLFAGLLPDRFGSDASIAILMLIAMSFYARAQIGEQYARHIQNGGERASSWAAAGIGILSVISAMILFIGLAVLLSLIDWSTTLGGMS